jgi:hypothetical protein
MTVHGAKGLEFDVAVADPGAICSWLVVTAVQPERRARRRRAGPVGVQRRRRPAAARLHDWRRSSPPAARDAEEEARPPTWQPPGQAPPDLSVDLQPNALKKEITRKPIACS